MKTAAPVLSTGLLLLIIVIVSTVSCAAENQRIGIPPQSKVIELSPRGASGDKSVWIKGYCMDKDLIAPQVLTAFNNLHTPDSIKVFTGNEKTPVRFADLIKLPNPQLTVNAYNLDIQFVNLSPAKLTIQIPQATVFGRVNGLETNPELLKILARAGTPPNSLDDLIELNEDVLQENIWRENAVLSLLRELGYWNKNVPKDQITYQNIQFALIKAINELKLPGNADLKKALDEEFKRRNGSSYILAFEQNLVDFRKYARERGLYVATLERTDTCTLGAFGIDVPKIRIYGQIKNLEKIINSSSNALLPIDYPCKIYTFSRLSIAQLPPGGIPPGEIWIDFENMEPAKFSEMLDKLVKKNDCSAEFCLNTKRESKVGFECSGYGIGVSSNKQFEVKIAGVTFPVPGPK